MLTRSHNVVLSTPFIYIAFDSNTGKKMDYKKQIERNPEVMLGKPVIRGTRITVELLMRKLASGYSISDLLKSYPHLTREQILAALEYAADLIANEETIESV
jgi:uncharacterized protein (DUF433 family)